MRMHLLILASMLTVTFGCPGDDTGTTDTDAATTSPTTTSETPTTTETPTTDTPTTDASTTGMPTTGDVEMTTGDVEMTTGDVEMTTGDMNTSGGSNAACETFCADYFSACGASEANDYGDEAGCVDACAGYDQKTYDCKAYHASMADGPDSVHCGHANIDGGGVC